MKITCQSCQSKYNVADEKVQGKIVKIRCRKCGATIVVNGTNDAAANGAGADATAQQGAADTTQWHVNVGDSDQRTLSLSELVDAYNGGVVTQDTFIWCDGMDDWRPLAEVESVVAALHASANQIALGTPGAFEPQGQVGGGYDTTTATAPAYQAPAAAPAYEAPPAYEPPPAAAYAAPAPEPKRAAVAKREARARDLFATNAGEELHTSAPAAPHGMAPAGGDGLTGQRNENSVLFSLAVLTKNADDRAPVETGAANKEDSGLIDLKALAAKAESMRPSAMADDGVFQAPLGFAPPLGAPMGALAGSGVDAQPKSKLPLLIGGGAGVLVLLVLGIVIGVKIAGSGPAPVASVLPAPTATAPEPSATQSAAAAEPSASAAPSASVAAAPAPKRYGGGGAWHPPAGGAAIPKPAGGSGGGSGGAAPSPTPKKSGGDCGCNGDLMCLMKCSTH
ncbi:MAG TPA: zinc-ribbon domain-containing protein [Polyangiaceae bacterium]|jgi:predicted Zn finger-like uncharacterized protein